MKFQMISTIERLQVYIQQEVFILLWILLLIGFIFYKLFLKEISYKRHLNLKSRFISTLYALILSSALAAIQLLLVEKFNGEWSLLFSHYAALFSLATGAVAVIKLAQIGAYLYLFFKNISQGIPRLIVNLFSVIFSLFVVSYIASEVFAVHVTAMLATSAVFSLVLGLALQDTLGNLFSGVAMQIGQPFKIGDWLEVTCDSKKWTGQVQEITWRATFLSSFSDEWIMIPNKTIAQSQIVILTNNHKVLRHSQMFRLELDSDLALAKKVMEESLVQMKGLMLDPAPRALIIETTESWVTMKVFYSVQDFSLKYRVADQVIAEVILNLQANQIRLATTRLKLQQT